MATPLSDNLVSLPARGDTTPDSSDIIPASGDTIPAIGDTSHSHHVMRHANLLENSDPFEMTPKVSTEKEDEAGHKNDFFTDTAVVDEEETKVAPKLAPNLSTYPLAEDVITAKESARQLYSERLENFKLRCQESISHHQNL